MKVVKSFMLHEDEIQSLVERIESVLEILIQKEGAKIISVNIVPLSYPGGRYGVIFYSQEEA